MPPSDIGLRTRAAPLSYVVLSSAQARTSAQVASRGQKFGQTFGGRRRQRGHWAQVACDTHERRVPVRRSCTDLGSPKIGTREALRPIWSPYLNRTLDRDKDKIACEKH